MSNTLVLINDLAKSTEDWMIKYGYQKSTIGFYKSTWNRFSAFSESVYYNRKEAERFLTEVYGINLYSFDKNDCRMRHAMRHINALEYYYQSGSIPRKIMRAGLKTPNKTFEHFFSEYIAYCMIQSYSRSWLYNTKSALCLFLDVIIANNITSKNNINAIAIVAYSDFIINYTGVCANVRRMHVQRVAAYLRWMYTHNYLEKDYTTLLPNIKRTVSSLPEIWSEDDIQKLLSIIDTASPVGKRNYTMFLLLSRTGLRISDVVSLKFSEIDWVKNCITKSQFKTTKYISVPISKEIGESIIAYLKHGRPKSDSEYLFLSHTFPYEPLGEHNNFHSEMRKYMRLAGIDYTSKTHSGVHTLRGSFATNMLKKGATIEDVSQSIGHSDINVTSTYLRIDIDQLRLCALSIQEACL